MSFKMSKIISRQQLEKKINCVRCCKADLVLSNAKIINVFTEEITLGKVAIFENLITGIGNNLIIERQETCIELDLKGKYVSAGLIDAHVHIESSMSTPGGFASVVLVCGTTTVIADPHEIANVCGIDGIEYFLGQSEGLPLHIYTMMPSCVPCSPFENNGRRLDARHMVNLKDNNAILGLGEVMNSGAVINCEGGMMEKLMLFQDKFLDGHAPMLTGQDLAAYSVAGIQTDHECSTFEEVKERISIGMKVMLRVGSAANDMEKIFSQIAKSNLPTENMMLCTDDKHVEDIRKKGHINHILKMAVAAGIPAISAVKMATINSARHYCLKNTGAIAPGYEADIVIFDDLVDFKVSDVIVDGKLLDKNPIFEMRPAPDAIRHTVHNRQLLLEDLKISIPAKVKTYPVMELYPHQLFTKLSYIGVEKLGLDENNKFVASGDFAKIVVVERHHAIGNVGLGIIQKFGLHGGAIASTVAHDSHNIVAIGDNDEDIVAAVNGLKEIGGGYTVAVKGKVVASLALPIAGLISESPALQTQNTQKKLIEVAYSLGIYPHYDPFLSLSFLALPVIPEVRITDMGMFDVLNSKFL